MFDIWTEDPMDISKYIPSSELNALGFINYNWDGSLPSSNLDSTIPAKFKGLTDLLALDCEMVTTILQNVDKKKQELGRVSIVNEYGYCVYDSFALPSDTVWRRIQDINGITKEILQNAPPIQGVLDRVHSLVEGRTLVGHDIGKDLKVLRLTSHPKVKDTQQIYRSLHSQPPGPGLEKLAGKYFPEIKITYPKSPILDAQLTLKLYLRVADRIETLPPDPVEVDPSDTSPLELPCGHTILQPSPRQRKSPKCNEVVEKTCPCGHVNKVPCHMDPSSFKCGRMVELTKSCPHHKKEGSFNCHQLSNLKVMNNSGEPVCIVPVEVTCPSGIHSRLVPCHEERIAQSELCNKEIKCKAGIHATSVPCGKTLKGKCMEPVLEVNCGSGVHSRWTECHKLGKGKIRACKKKVLITQPCGHSVQLPCARSKEEVPPPLCTQTLFVTCKAGLHTQNVRCYKREKPLGACNAEVSKTLGCGHEVEVVCAQRKMPKCAEVVDTKCKRGLHTHSMPCGETQDNCKMIVKVTCKEGLHSVLVECDDASLGPCKEWVLKKNPTCGHLSHVACAQKKMPKCPAVVDTKCKKGLHTHSVQCGETQDNCKMIVKVTCKEGRHSSLVECDTVSLQPCKALMLKKNPECGHLSHVTCGQKVMPPCRYNVDLCEEGLHPGVVECWALKYESCKAMVRLELHCGHIVLTSCDEEDVPECTRKVEVVCKEGLHSRFVECLRLAEEKDAPCTTPIVKVLPCGHVHKLECWQKDDLWKILCLETVAVRCPEGLHLQDVPCHRVGKDKGLRSSSCKAMMKCSHGTAYPCDLDKRRSYQFRCHYSCTRTLSACGHKCQRLCHEDTASVHKCFSQCQRVFQPCGHNCEKSLHHRHLCTEHPAECEACIRAKQTMEEIKTYISAIVFMTICYYFLNDFRK